MHTVQYKITLLDSRPMVRKKTTGPTQKIMLDGSHCFFFLCVAARRWICHAKVRICCTCKIPFSFLLLAAYSCSTMMHYAQLRTRSRPRRRFKRVPMSSYVFARVFINFTRFFCL